MKLKYGQLIECVSKTRLSPEEVAPYFGVSNMTYRRWQKKKPQEIDAAYLAGAYDGIFALVAKGFLQMESPEVKILIEQYYRENNNQYILAVSKSLGVEGTPPLTDSTQNQFVTTLSQIGSSLERQQRVESSWKEISEHQKRGSEWSESIQSLMNVIKSNIVGADKWAAYGGLFYLIFCFDFIPDYIPVFGLLDDFATLGLARSYYKKRFS